MQVNRMLRVLLIIAVSKNRFIVREETEKCIKRHLVFSVNFILARTHTHTTTSMKHAEKYHAEQMPLLSIAILRRKG